MYGMLHTKNDTFFTDNSRNVALSMCTDGVPIFKSQMWPVYYSILNLPASLRAKSKNIILSGLWIGPSKPLLQPLMNEIDHLTIDGMIIELSKDRI